MAQVPMPRVPQPGLVSQQRPPPGTPRMMGLQAATADGVDGVSQHGQPTATSYQQQQYHHHAPHHHHHQHQQHQQHSQYPSHTQHPQPYHYQQQTSQVSQPRQQQQQFQQQPQSSFHHHQHQQHHQQPQYHSSQQQQYGQYSSQGYQSGGYQQSQYSQSYSAQQSSQHVQASPQPQTQPTAAASSQPPQAVSPTLPGTQNGPSSSTAGAISSSNSSDSQILSPSIGSAKEKTPMCLINELARYNKVQHQYRLTQESGPAHKRTFTVTLKLGEEEYTASGPSIKKAQHAAAAIALEKTTYKHPPPKMQAQNRPGGRSNITPTVELNALAMKRGELAVYTFIEPPRPGPYFAPNFNFRGMYNQIRSIPPMFSYDFPAPHRPPNRLGDFSTQQRYAYGKQGGYPPMFRVTLRVGQKEFVGEGPTPQAARHSAASQALRCLRDMPVPNGKADSVENGDCDYQGDDSDIDANSDLKSPISLVHEVALKRNFSVNFEVVRESGPPHMRTFVTQCTVGDFITEGEGNGKKVSKKRAAEKMLEELKKLPQLPPPPVTKIKRKPSTTKKKSRNLIKEQTPTAEFPQGINPISRLIQIQQAKKEKEPVYSLLAERGMPRRREFVMQVTVGAHCTTGTGPNKKLAKRSAAEALLQMMGYSHTTSQPGKTAMKGNEGGPDVDKARKVTFMEEAPGKDKSDISVGSTSVGGSSSGGRQLVPGLLLMPEGHSSSASIQSYQPPGGGSIQPPSAMNIGSAPLVSLQTTATIAKELLNGGTSPTADALLKSGQIQSASSPPTSSAPTPIPTPAQPPTPTASPSHSAPIQAPQPTGNGTSAPSQKGESQFVGPKDQLLYLAQLLNFEVQFTDFPKGNRSEYLSLVSLSTDPPQVSHGSGPTTDASHDRAAFNALRSLAEFGLDSVTPGNAIKKEAGNLAGGDGLHLTNGQKASTNAVGK